MWKKETRLKTGLTNRSKSAMAIVEERDDATGRGESPMIRREEALSAEMLRIIPRNGDGSRRSLSSLGRTRGDAKDDTRLSISAGKWGQEVVPVKGDALDQLLSSSQRGLGGTLQSRVCGVGSETDLPMTREYQRPVTNMRAAFLAPPMTPNAAAKARLDKIRGQYSNELKQLQVRLMRDEGRPFSSFQKALVFDNAASQSHDDALKKAVGVATDNEIQASDALIHELRSLARAPPGEQVPYDELLRVVWEDKYFTSAPRHVKPGRGNVMKYLFLVGSGAGCYNDNIEPEPSLFGVKKGSSSVRYSLFTNENVDQTSTFKLVPQEMMKAVDNDMKVSVSLHPHTGRPLDPWLSYLAVSQGKKCESELFSKECTSPQPMDILKLQQRKGVSREWDCLPNFSFGFTKMHKGEWRAAERRNMVL